MPTDAELLKRYAQGGSEAAFAELVERHVNLVYGAAIRQTKGDASLAEDLTQAVFTAMARQAETLIQHPVLSGWLYQYVRHLAANQHRADQRRQRREQDAIKMNTPNSPAETDPLWEEVKPVLDDAMHGLEDKDRNAVVLRFYEDLSLREVGEALGLSENAARMRVGRALNRLRDLLAQRGVSSTVPGLATALGVGATFSAPAGMAATVATNALAATACVGAATTTTTLAAIMSMTKAKIVVSGLLTIAGIGLIALQEHRVRNLQTEKAELQALIAESPAPRAETELKPGTETDPDPTEELREAKLEIARLRGRLTMAMAGLREQAAAKSKVAEKKTEPDADLPDMSTVMQASMRAAMESQTIGKLPRLTERLGLSPAQQEKARAILQRQFDEGLEIATSLLAGKPIENVSQPKSGGDPMAEFKALLTPEQQAAYQEHEQEEKTSMARLAANGELLQMQSPLGLTQEQQDQVFDVLYRQSLGQMANPTPMPQNQSSDPTATMRWFVDQKVSALEDILSAGQLEKYREIQERQLELTAKMMPRRNP